MLWERQQASIPNPEPQTPNPERWLMLWERQQVYGASANTPLVLDFGSYSMRAGWAGQKDPALNFRSLTGKAKNSAGEIVTVAGDQLLCRDITKTALKSPFERDVVQNLESTETLFDYTLSQLGINSERLQHPVLMTEGVCTPNYSRGRMSEFLFECYGAPKVAYATDALLSYEYNTYASDLASASALTAPWTGPASSGLVVRVGNACAHVIPIINGAAVLASAYRLNAGGKSVSDTLHEVLRQRYPQHRPAITASRVNFIKEHLCYVPYDYSRTVQGMAREFETSDADAPLSFVKRVQLPYTDKEVRVCVCACVRVCVSVCVCVSVYTHTHTLTRTHVCRYQNRRQRTWNAGTNCGRNRLYVSRKWPVSNARRNLQHSPTTSRPCWSCRHSSKLPGRGRPRQSLRKFRLWVCLRCDTSLVCLV